MAHNRTSTPSGSSADQQTDPSSLSPSDVLSATSRMASRTPASHCPIRMYIPSEQPPDWNGDDGGSQAQHERSRDIGGELLQELVSKPIPPRPKETPSAQELSDEDQAILDWFKQTKLGKQLTILQVYWCIGYVDRPALQSGAQAMGWHTVRKRLRALRPHFKGPRLPGSIDYLSRSCMKRIADEFIHGPFELDHTVENRTEEFRAPLPIGRKQFSRWTPKALKAWQYVDRYLTILGAVPEFAGPVELALQFDSTGQDPYSAAVVRSANDVVFAASGR